jgi:ATPase family associated with various cellular activities (AAA)
MIQRPALVAASSVRRPMQPLGRRQVSMTLSNGTRLYFARNDDEPAVYEPASRLPLLGVSMTTLLHRARTAARAPLRRGGIPAAAAAPKLTDLWVDRHAPTRFLHLLSDERTHRLVVRALRAWDPHVFGRPAPEMLSATATAAATTTTTKPATDLRPDERQRVLLLSGPPGIGKTTMAHILARHVGYQPLEINGSDERCNLVEQIRSMESQSVLSTTTAAHNAKPHLMIVDECDGMDPRGTAALLQLIRAPAPSTGAKKQPYLRRPLLFICNQPYAPAVRPLLPYCRHFCVQAPTTSRLVARLQAILQAEQFSIPAQALHPLVTQANGDIRSCLNTLQFASVRAKQQNGQGCRIELGPALASVLQGDSGKDARYDLVGTLQTVFRKDRRASAMRILDAVEVRTNGTSIHQDLIVPYTLSSTCLDVRRAWETPHDYSMLSLSMFPVFPLLTRPWTVAPPPRNGCPAPTSIAVTIVPTARSDIAWSNGMFPPRPPWYMYSVAWSSRRI